MLCLKLPYAHLEPIGSVCNLFFIWSRLKMTKQQNYKSVENKENDRKTKQALSVKGEVH